MTESDCRRFVVVATQRSGSTLLVKSLDSAPTIFCAGEMFHGGPNTLHPECNYPQKLLGSSLLGRVADRYFQGPRVRKHVLTFYSRQRAGIKAVGFKVMTSQLRSYHTLLPLLVATDTVRFFLHREDSFAAALSTFRAKSSGVYHSDRVAVPASSQTVNANPDEFQLLLKRSKAHRQEALDLHARYGGVLLTYESLIKHWDSLIAEMGDKLGIPQLRVGKALDRIGDAAEPVRIGNLEELREKFGSGTNP